MFGPSLTRGNGDEGVDYLVVKFELLNVRVVVVFVVVVFLII